MKKLLLFIAGFIFCLILKGQEIITDSVKFSYCELVGTEKLFSNKVTVEIDFGQVRKFFADNRYKDPATGKPIAFNSMIDALNFMGKNNWEFVQAYIITQGSGNSLQNVYHFLLKKRTSMLEKE